MMRKLGATFLVASLLAGVAWAADVTGKFVKVDAAKNALVYTDEDGKEKTVAVGAEFKVFDAAGVELKGGVKDPKLAAGAPVRLVLTAAGKTAKELHLVPAAKSEPKSKTPPKTRDKSESKDKAAEGPKFGENAKGEVVKITKIDPEKRLVTVEYANGKKVDLGVAEKAKVLGPRGGAADLKDDRLTVGHHVKIVTDTAGKLITEVHLAYRGSDEK